MVRLRRPRPVPLLIALVVTVLVALPVGLAVFAQAARRDRLWNQINRELTAVFRLKEELKAAYARVGGVKRLPHETQVLYEYEQRFRRLHNRTYDARQADPPPSPATLAALRREWEQLHRRLSGHLARLQRLVALTELAEKAVVRARFYQGVLRVVQAVAPYEGNEDLLPQLAEADRQLRTAMAWVLTGIERYPQDLKAIETPILLKAGVRQIRDVTADVDRLLAQLKGTERVRVPEAGGSLQAYLERVRRESEKSRLPPLPGGGSP